jgi:N-acetylglucosamine-6-sulfatase
MRLHRAPGPRRRIPVATLTVLAAALVVTSCTSGSAPASAPSTTSSTPSSTGTTPAAGRTRPNIVFVLTDDLSWNLMTEQFAPHIMDLARRGMTFDHFFVPDSLCCPSRATIFTGLYPHDTHVETNYPPDGGFQKFQEEHLDQRTYAVDLHGNGYQTSMLGKYLNNYGDPMNPSSAPVPPGWTDWHVSNSTGYGEYDFRQNDNGAFNTYTGNDNYGVDVINRQTQQFIQKNTHQPFALEVATYAPHQPYVPATRNANDFPGLTEPRDPSFDAQNQNPPAWLGVRGPLHPKQIENIDESYRKRAQTVEAIDKLVADTEATLRANGLLDKTYFVFSSDNGYHLGQHRMIRGKKTAFDTDIRVPLIVAGPGVRHGVTDHHVVESVDLAPTFAELTGTTRHQPFEGHSFTPLLHPTTRDPHWRTVALLEHKRHGFNPTDPDNDGGKKDDPTTYEGIRISADHLPHFHGHLEAVYVEYADAQHETEFYDIAKDPYEIDNTTGKLTDAQRSELHKTIADLQRCHTATTCWSAALPR